MAFLDEIGLAELWSLIKEEDNKLSAADVKIASGTYTGNGKSGSSNPNTLTFDFTPKIILIGRENSGEAGLLISPARYGQYFNGGNNNSFEVVSWSGNTVSWYNTAAASAQPATLQLNVSGTTYCYVAIG